MTGVSLGTRFESQPTALNTIRLVLAMTVVVWHAGLLSELSIPWPAWQLLEEFAVDAFFAISGFLITRSWLRQRDVRKFAIARAARLLPGLWVCLALTAFVIAPLVAPVGFADQLRYVASNAGVFVTDPNIAGLPVQWGVLNLSLWSLWWELLAYAAVVALGSLRLLRVPVLLGLASFFWSIMFALTAAGIWPAIHGTVWISAIPRLGLMFTCGALLYLLADRVPVRGWLAGVAAALILLGAVTPNYHLVAAPAVAYLMLWLGLTLGRFPALRLEHDLSYGVYVYGFPIQQALLVAGAAGLGWAVFSVVSLAVVLPVAATSWFLVERPSMRGARQVVARIVEPSHQPTVTGLSVAPSHSTMVPGLSEVPSHR